MTFTPGPWFVMDGTVMSAATGTVAHMEKSNPDRKHNAQLIAAAPDMLAALEIATKHANENSDDYQLIVDTIALAIGVQS